MQCLPKPDDNLKVYAILVTLAPQSIGFLVR